MGMDVFEKLRIRITFIKSLWYLKVEYNVLETFENVLKQFLSYSFRQIFGRARKLSQNLWT